MFDYQEIIDRYINWIRDNTSIKEIANGRYGEITTPFLDRHNDHIVIYVKKDRDKILLTDDGYTIEDLKMTGMDIASSPKREKFFKTVLNGFGVKVGEKNDLSVEANIANVAQKKHSLLQAILAVNDMYVLSQENIFSFFREDVERFFTINKIFYTKDIKISGRSGFDHNMDFVIPASTKYPERLIKTLNTPNKNTALGAIFAFTDIVTMREQQTRNIVFYNDADRTVPAEVVSAFRNYEIEGIAWSERDRHVKELQMS